MKMGGPCDGANVPVPTLSRALPSSPETSSRVRRAGSGSTRLNENPSIDVPVATRSMPRKPMCRCGAQVPLSRHDGGDRSDDEQVVGVGERSQTRDEDGPAVEPSPGRLVEQVADSDRREP